MLSLAKVFPANAFKSMLLALGLALLMWANPAQADYTVSGAGSTEVNGTYTQVADYMGAPSYRLGATNYYIFHQSGYWFIANGQGGMGSYRSSDGDATAPPSTGWQVYMMGANPAPTVGPAGPSVSFSSKTLFESLDDDGSFPDPITLSHNLLDGDGFVGLVSENFLATGKATISNLPAGLSVTLTLNSSSELVLAFGGTAPANTQADNVTDLTLAFDGSAFISGDASINNNALVNDLTLQFRDLHTVGSGGDFATIAAAVAGANAYDILELAAEVFTEKNININKVLVIRGQGAAQTIVEAMAVPESEQGRIFDIGSNLQEVRISGLTLRNGFRSTEFGNEYGGAINALSPLILEDCRLSNNRTVSSGTGGGGALLSTSSLHVNRCLFDGNSTARTDGGNQVSGGAVLIAFSSEAIIANATFINNSVTANNPGSGAGTNGGAISFEGKLTLINSTLSENTTNGLGGGVGTIFGSSDAVTIQNSIIYNNTAALEPASADVWVPSGQTVAYSDSIVGQRTTDNTNIDDNLISADPLLSALADNGGPTQTLALQAGSPAIGAGTSGANTPNQDQRGFWRIGSVDIGAYQLDGVDFELIFDGNGADAGSPPVYQGEAVYPDEKTLAKTEHSFNGWNSAADGSGTAYAAGAAIVPPVGALTLFAQWTALTITNYTITFESAGGTAVTAITQDFGTNITAPVNPTRAGYTFAGWNPALPSTMPVDGSAHTAQWTAIAITNYTITFDSAGGSAVNPLTQASGTPVFPPVAPTKAGHTFAGWAPELPPTMPVDGSAHTALWTANQTSSVGVELFSPSGEPLQNRLFATNQDIVIVLQVGEQPILIGGLVRRGIESNVLLQDSQPNILLKDGDGDRSVLTLRNNRYVFRAQRGGRYELNFTDSNGQVFSTELDIRAQVAFTTTRQPAATGEQVSVRVALQGIPAQYPVTVPYEVINHDLLSSSDLTVTGEFTFEAGGTQEILQTFRLTPAASVGDVTITLQQNPDSNGALLGNPASHRLVLRDPAELPLPVRLAIEQGGDDLTTLAVAHRDNGIVTVTAINPATDMAFDSASYRFDWSQSALILGVHSDVGASVQIDPTLITTDDVGMIRVVVTETSGAQRQMLAATRLRFVHNENVAANDAFTAFLTAGQASRNRLPICPQGEGDFRDQANRQCSQSDRATTAVYLEAPEGFRLTLGQMSERASWETRDFGLEISPDEIREEGADVPVRNARDTLYSHIGYLVDFEVAELDFAGQSVPVVIPLSKDATIPSGAVWRKYIRQNWENFVVNDANQVFSASTTGDCPWPGSDLWKEGLNEGDNCVRLVIEDGGPNDSDGMADGVIRDPGTLAVSGGSSGQKKLTSNRGGLSSMGGLLLVLLLLVLLKQRRLILLSTLLAAGSVQAQNVDSWSFGLQLGMASTDMSNTDVNKRLSREGIDGEASVSNSNRFAGRVFLGYQWNPYWGLETGLIDLGEITTRFNGLDSNVRAADFKKVAPGTGRGVDFAVVGRYPLNDDLDVTAKLGMLVWHTSLNLESGGSYSHSGHDALVGLGIDYRVNTLWSTHVSLDRYKVERDVTNFISAGFSYHFGGW